LRVAVSTLTLMAAAAQADTQSWSLDLQAGDFVRGRVEGPPTPLDLRHADGQPVRRLLAEGEGRDRFMFVAPGAGRYQLVATGPRADALVLALEPVVPRAEQQSLPERLPSPLLQQLADRLAEPDARPAQLIDAFWQDMATRGTPLVEDTPGAACLERVPSGETGAPLRAGAKTGVTAATRAEPSAPCLVQVTFLWRGARADVRVVGSPSGDHDPMTRLAGTDIWWRTYAVPDSTHLGYTLAPDVPRLPVPAAQQRRNLLATAQRDPGNPRWMTATGEPPVDPYDGESVLSLPHAPPQPWVAQRKGVSQGVVERVQFDSALLGNRRELVLYRPPGWIEDPRDPRAADQNLLVLFDAHAYARQVPTPTVLDNLMADGLLGRTAALIVGNGPGSARGDELPPNPRFARFLAEELMPWARTVGQAAPAGRTVVAGSSYGGLAAAYAALRHPELFGQVLSLSGSFWWRLPDERPAGSSTFDAAYEPGWLTRQYAARERLPLRFYLEAGLFESGSGGGGILESTRHLRDVLRARGYAVTHAEWASGHDYQQWQGGLGCGLVALLGPGPEARTAEQARQIAQACPGRP